MTTLESNPVYYLFTNEDDTRAIEDAVRSAIKVVLKVFCTINSNKVKEYQRRATETDKENEMLKIRVESMERELKTLRRFKVSVEQNYCTLNPDSDDPQRQDSGVSPGNNGKQQHIFHDAAKEVLSDCLLKTKNVGPYEGTYSCEHPLETEGTTCSWRSSAVVYLNDQVPTERATSPMTSEGQPENRRASVASPTVQVKEEPPSFEDICIKWELSEETVKEESEAYLRPPSCSPLFQCRGGDYAAVGAQGINFGLLDQPRQRLTASESCLRKRLSNRERQQKYRERIRADPERQQAYREKDRSRYHKRRKLIRDLPEHCQKLKREAWREAARRHRARKKYSLPQCPLTQTSDTVGY
ncbi:hypothetical protein AGOR_G00210110 [Albula goreensis]|uniref:Uncharacterized protein n=1 Tax=Albula goreensis TaxID=1534307 RepID=A0A8T3CQI6_9TELE|nr:hypothetical protein AGOR_G00210110 [Albula goreensis]